MNAFTYLFLFMLAVSLMLKLWLAHRHARHVGAHRDRVPAEFQGKVSEQAHRRAADYTVASTRFGRLENIYAAALLLLWTLGGGLDLLDEAWRAAGLGTVSTGVGVLVSAMLIMALLELPLSTYHTFVIEQRFGFNRTTPTIFLTDLAKSAALTLALGVPLAWVVLWIMQGAGALWWLYVWAVWFGFSLAMMWAYPAFIAPLFNRFRPLGDAGLKSRIERLLNECGFKSNGIFVMDGSRRSTHGNAYFGGIGNNKRIVFFDTLIDQLDGDEIEAVLAHELGHFRLHHIRKRLAGVGLFSLLGLALLGWLIEQPWFYTGLGASRPSDYMALLLFMLSAPVFGFLLTPALSALSRRHEFEADAYAARTRDAGALVRALVKLYEENASTLTPDPLYSRFYYSHPPASIRIEQLKHQSGQRLAEGAPA